MALEITQMKNGNTLAGIKITPGRTTIGFVARGMRAGNHSPSLKQQHADCLLPFGEIVGFSNTGSAASGGSLSHSSVYCDINVEGAVVNAAILEATARANPNPKAREQAKRLIIAESAKQADYMSGILLIEAPQPNVDRFINNWLELGKNPKTFNIIGGNCSTRAKDIFVASQIIPSINFLIDTPTKLFAHLTYALNGDPKYKLTSYFGYFGLEKKLKGRYDLVILW